MHKKLMLACMAIAAFAAFVMAPVASASPVLTDETPGGQIDILQPGAWITATNTGDTVFTGTFNVHCDHVHLSGTVLENTGTSIKGEIPVGNAKFNGTGTSTDCTSALGSVKVTVNSKLCLSMSKGSDTVTTTGCGANITFTLEITGTGPCKYETASVSSAATTGTNTVTTTEQESKGESSNGFFCPTSGKLDMVFDVFTTDGTPVIVS